ncbi:hypothetical protein K432DRAFT_411344 [Lepidopterella palustris CBS 459.81]|uniref:Uncharacterized protein n=1 Tax=Lepidopterella palustris CBS 459.81 TaxID=1314670 RepID=A0A8E2DWJ4_9PEZI|nr:hypothetical protein K432DRAFT_411344 [Lepidopterella palustris CBS 459.81]
MSTRANWLCFVTALEHPGFASALMTALEYLASLHDGSRAIELRFSTYDSPSTARRFSIQAPCFTSVFMIALEHLAPLQPPLQHLSHLSNLASLQSSWQHLSNLTSLRHHSDKRSQLSSAHLRDQFAKKRQASLSSQLDRPRCMTALTQANHAISRLHSNERNQPRNESHGLTPVVSHPVLHDATSDIRHLSTGSAGKSVLLLNARHQSNGSSSRSLTFLRFRVSMLTYEHCIFTRSL